MTRSSPPVQQTTKHHNPGFSLTELLVAATVSSITVVAAVQILGPQLRMNQRLEGYNRLQERWARIAYLLDTEIPKARTIAANGNNLTLTVPVTTTSGGAAISSITYKQIGSQLFRDGPAITEWGRLDPGSMQTNQLVLDGVNTNSFVPTVNAASVQYRINLWDPNSDATYTGRGSAARGKADCLSLEADANASASALCD